MSLEEGKKNLFTLDCDKRDIININEIFKKIYGNNKKIQKILINKIQPLFLKINFLLVFHLIGN